MFGQLPGSGPAADGSSTPHGTVPVPGHRSLKQPGATVSHQLIPAYRLPAGGISRPGVAAPDVQGR